VFDVEAARIEQGTIVDGRYRVDEPIGAGGFATVYAGWHLTLEVRVAIKVLRLEGNPSPETRADHLAGFMEEARLVTRLRHDKIVRTLDQGIFRADSAEPLPYVVLEWCGDESLKQRLLRRRAPFPIEEALAITDAIADGMAHAHEAGVVHRDLKPGNIMIADAADGSLTVRIIDFGIAKLFEGKRTTSGYTRSDSTGSFTPAYAAPEQLAGLRTGPWTDVHAIGLILGELLTLRPPFVDDGKTLGAVDPNRPTPARHGIDVGALEPVIARAVAFRPDDRPRDAGELRDELRRAGRALMGVRPAVASSMLSLTTATPDFEARTESPISHTHREADTEVSPEVAAPHPSSTVGRGVLASVALAGALASAIVGPRLWAPRLQAAVSSSSLGPVAASAVSASPPASSASATNTAQKHVDDLTVDELAARVEAAGMDITEKGETDGGGTIMKFVHYVAPDGSTGTAYVNHIRWPKGTPRASMPLLSMDLVKSWIEFDRQIGLELFYGVEGQAVMSFATSAKTAAAGRERFAKLVAGLTFDVQGSSFGAPDKDPATKLADAKSLWSARSIDDLSMGELGSRLHLVDADATNTAFSATRWTCAIQRGSDVGTLDVFFRAEEANLLVADLRSRGVSFAIARGKSVVIVAQGPKRLDPTGLLAGALEGLGPFETK
jgi:serine/threonine protein kinase